MLWANLHLLFWLSLFPFATGWMGENHFAAAPSALYGVVLLMAAIAYWILQQTIIASQGRDSLLRKAIGSDWKGKMSPLIYAVAIPAAFWSNLVSPGALRARRADVARARPAHRERARGEGEPMTTVGRGVAWVVSITAALALGVAGAILLRPQAGLQPPPLLSLEKMGHLASVKVNVADIVEFTENRTFDIPWSSWEFQYAGTKVLLIVKGDCLVGTDLRAGRYEGVDHAGRTATLVLPPPELLQARLNHAAPEQGGSRLYSVSNLGIEALIPGNSNRLKAIDAAMRIAQRKVEDAGRAPEVTRAARENAEALLRSSFAAVGWTISIKWQEPRTES